MGIYILNFNADTGLSVFQHIELEKVDSKAQQLVLQLTNHGVQTVHVCLLLFYKTLFVVQSNAREAGIQKTT